MRSSKRKPAMKVPKKSVLKSGPVVFVLVFLLGALLIDIYKVITAKHTKHDHSHYRNEQTNKKTPRLDGHRFNGM